MGGDVPILPPLEALRYFRDKGFRFGFAWQDVWQAEHAIAFTVAKAMTRDVLETIRAAVDQAIEQGETLDQFRKELRPKLEALGWWGRKTMIDPLTAQAKTVQLGSPRRLRTIYEVNLRTAYQAGRWERIQAQKAAFPYLRYTSVMDGRERPQHHAWHGTVRPVDDAWWDTHYPPCGWNCRCTATAFSQRMLDKRGYEVTDNPAAFEQRAWTNKRTGEVTRIEDGIDPGWSYNVGKARMDALAVSPLPAGFEGTDTAAVREIAAGLAAFFALFGVKAADAAQGQVFTDKGGWPVALSLAWWRCGNRFAPIASRPPTELARIARAIADPAEIRWVWVTGLNGAAMLFRRYVALDAGGTIDAIVDIGRDGWRARLAAPGDELAPLRRGAISWQADGTAAAGYNPYQPRAPKGSPQGGQFRPTGVRSTIARVRAGHLDGPMVRTGDISPEAMARIHALRINLRSPAVWISPSSVRHTLKRHGKDDHPPHERDIAGVHRLISRAHTITRGDSKGGFSRIRAVVGKQHPTIALMEVRRRGLVLVSVHRRQGPRR